MTDIARLSFEIDSSKAKSATGDLDSLSQASTRAQASALVLQRSLEQGRLSFDQYAQAMTAMNTSIAGTTRSLDDMVDRVGRLSRTISDMSGATGQPLREAIAQMQSLGQQFGTGAAGIDNFVRASRNIGLSASETIGALQRIQQAMEGVTEQGRQARQVIESYGVSVRGSATRDASDVLRDLRTASASYSPGFSQAQALQMALGPMSTDTQVGFTMPGYRTIDEQRTTLRDAARDRARGALNQDLFLSGRETQTQLERYRDLQNNFSSWFDPQDWNPFASRDDDMRRWSERERNGEVPTNMTRIGRGITEGGIARYFRFQLGDEGTNDERAIKQLYDRERADGADWFSARGRQLERLLRLPFASSSVLNNQERAALRPRGPFDEPTDPYILGISRSSWEQGAVTNAERNAYDNNRSPYEAMEERNNTSIAQEARSMGDPDRAAAYSRFSRWSFGNQLDLLSSRANAGLRYQSRVMTAGSDALAAGDFGASFAARAFEQGSWTRTDPNNILRLIASQGVAASAQEAGQGSIQAGLAESLSQIAGRGYSAEEYTERSRTAQVRSRFQPYIEAAREGGFTDFVNRMEQAIQAVTRFSMAADASATAMRLNFTAAGNAAAGGIMGENAGAPAGMRGYMGRLDQAALQAFGSQIPNELSPMQRLAEARRLMRENPSAAGTIADGLATESAMQNQASQGGYLGQLGVAGAAVTGDPRTDRYAIYNAQLRALRLDPSLGADPTGESLTRATNLLSTQFRSNESARYGGFALSQGYAISDLGLQLSPYGIRMGEIPGQTLVGNGAGAGRGGGDMAEIRQNLLTMFPAARVTSGTRSPSANAAAGGASNSYHLSGRATDFSLAGLNEEERAAFVQAAIGMSGVGGLGMYGQNGTMLHVDTGRGPRAWGPNYSRTSLDQTPSYFQEAVRGWMNGGPRGGGPGQTQPVVAPSGWTMTGGAGALSYDQSLGALYGGSEIQAEIRARSAMRADQTGDYGGTLLRETIRAASESILSLGQAAARATVSFGNTQRENQAFATSGPFGANVERVRQSVQPEVEGATRQAASLRAMAARTSDPAQRAMLLQQASVLESQARRAPEMAEANFNERTRGDFQRAERSLTQEGEILDMRLARPFASETTIGRDVALGRASQQLENNYGTAISAEQREKYLKEVGRQYDGRELARQNAEIRDTFIGIAEASGNALAQIIVNGGRARVVMSQLAATTASMLSSIALRGAANWAGDKVFSLIGSIFSGGTGAAVSGIGPVASVTTQALPPLPNAQGNVFNRGFITPLSQGEVFDSIATRPMANGNTAMMGEAGPEAAVPLVRMPSGNLGIRASGSSGAFAPSITINMNGSQSGGASSSEQARAVGQAVKDAVRQQWEEATRDNMRVGGVFNPVYR